jgi:hypothetical protein
MWRGRYRDRGAGSSGNGDGQVLKIGSKECRRWAWERARQSAASWERKRVPGMGRNGQKG